MICGGFLEAAGARLGVNGVGLLLSGFTLLITLYHWGDLGLHFIEGTGVCRLFFDQLNDVIAVGGFDEIAELSFLVELKGGLIEFRHHAAVLEPSQFTALLGAAGIL